MPEPNNNGGSSYFAGMPEWGTVSDFMWNGDNDTVYYLKEAIFWDQGYPYNSELPAIVDAPIDPISWDSVRYKVGCANIALLNVMAYAKRPSATTWRNFLNSPVLSDWTHPTIRREGALLCKDVYKKTGSKSDSITGATVTSISGLYAGIDSVNMAAAPLYRGFNVEVIKQSLRYQRVSIIAAQNKKDTTSTVGHAYVVRGWWKSKYYYPLYDEEITTESLAINWGYSGGFGDGWYCSIFDGKGFDQGIILSPLVMTDYGPAYADRDWTRDMGIISHLTFKGGGIPTLPN